MITTMVEIFKTNVQNRCDSVKVIGLLLSKFPTHKINFDLEDRDKILRIESDAIPVAEITALVHSNGFSCELIE